jgi:UDP-N-acetylmuramoyl-tripeptide--D-alanyl-D-alanine ligase
VRIAALTGSNGKTTVKEMLAAILRNCGEVLATRGNLNNEIGLPSTLLRLVEGHDYAVVEMGANHPGEIAYLAGLACPDVALVTNVGPAHLAGFGDLNGVARAKGEIYQGLRPDGVAVINRDEPYASYWKTLVGSRRSIEFGLDPDAEVSGRVLDSSRNRFRLRIDGRYIDIELPLPGLHNVRNALGAAAASFALGATPESIRAGLEQVSPVSGRLQQLSGRGGSTVVNDTYNANPASLQAAMNVVGAWRGARWLVLGDMGELGRETATLHAQAGIQARQAGFERLFALGEYSREAAAAFGANGLHFEAMDELLESVAGTLATARDAPIILVKGSRSMRMERAVAALTTGPDRNSTSGER